jgi:hypothetical protein
LKNNTNKIGLLAKRDGYLLLAMCERLRPPVGFKTVENMQTKFMAFEKATAILTF